MALFAVLSTVSLGMILPFMNVLFSEQVLVADGELGSDAGGGDLLQSVTEDLPSVGGLKEDLKERVLEFFASGTASEALGKICIALLVIFFIKSLFGYLQTFLMVTVEQRVIRDIRNALFAHLNELSLSFFHGQRTGQLISRITNDVTLVRKALVATFANLFREALLTRSCTSGWPSGSAGGSPSSPLSCSRP